MLTFCVSFWRRQRTFHFENARFETHVLKLVLFCFCWVEICVLSVSRVELAFWRFGFLPTTRFGHVLGYVLKRCVSVLSFWAAKPLYIPLYTPMGSWCLARFHGACGAAPLTNGDLGDCRGAALDGLRGADAGDVRCGGRAVLCDHAPPRYRAAVPHRMGRRHPVVTHAA